MIRTPVVFVGLLLLAARWPAIGEEVEHGPWKAEYHRGGLVRLTYQGSEFLRQTSLTVFKPGYKAHWFSMTHAEVTLSRRADAVCLRWTKRDGDRVAAELELTLAEAATWRGRIEVGVEGPVEMGVLVAPDKAGPEPPTSLAKPLVIESPQWSATLQTRSSERPWMLQDRRQTAEKWLRAIVCFRATGRERLVAEAELVLRVRAWPVAEQAGRAKLLAQRARTFVPVAVKNAGFEESTRAAGWAAGRNATIDASVRAPEGKRCLRMVMEPGRKDGCYVTQRIPVHPGARYRLSGMIRTEAVVPDPTAKMSSVGATLIIEWVDAAGKWLAPGSYAEQANFGTRDWRRVECQEVPAPERAGFAVIYCALRGTGVAWFDDVRLVECRPAVVLRTPLDGTTLADNRPLLAWQPDNDARAYRVELGRDAQLGGGGTHPAPIECFDNECRPAKPLAPGRWYWRVLRDDGYPSAVWSFTQSAPFDADTSGPDVELAPASIANRRRPAEFAAHDRSGIATGSIRLLVDGRPVDAELAFASGKGKIAPRAGWAPGAHEVVVQVADTKGNRASRSTWIAVAPAPAAAVTWTRDRGVMIGSQRRFPLGIYQVSIENMARVRAAGFDVVHNYSFESSQDDAAARAYLDAAARHGLMAFVGFDRGHGGAGLCQMNLEHVARRVAALRDHPALLAWYLFDEPDSAQQYISPRNLRRLYDTLRALDPYHPVIVTFASGPSTAAYPRCYDVYWSQVYRTTEELDKKLAFDRAAIGDAPLMAIVHCYDREQTTLLRAGRKPREAAFQPDATWMQANACAALAHGTSGLCWWWYGDGGRTFMSAGDVPAAWENLTRLVGQLRQHEKLLVAEGTTPAVSIEPADAPVRVRAKRVGDLVLLVAVNLRRDPVRVTLRSAELPGELRESFGPLESRVWQVTRHRVQRAAHSPTAGPATPD